MALILIVDDHSQNVKFLETILQRENYDVISAFDGEEGMKLVYDKHPDLILLDIMLPKVNGLEICEKLTKDPVTKDIPIILVTARVSADDTSVGLQAGAHDYIKKPFERVEIIARIKAALKLREAQKKSVEVEKLNIFAATVVTANHKIKQPLTVIKLALSSIKREVEKEAPSKENLIKRVEYIETAVDEITYILNQLRDIQNPRLSDYVKDIKMVDIDSENQE